MNMIINNHSSLHTIRYGISYKNSDVINVVLIIWVATNPKSGGTYVVGWYKDAELYSSEQKNIEARNYGGDVIGYYAKAKKENVTLLPIDERNCRIPRGKGWIGNNNVWYADAQDEETKSKQRNLKKLF